MPSAGTSWGRYPPIAGGEQVIAVVDDRASPLPAQPRILLPYGNGRSYGDSCLNPGGTLLCTRGLDRFIQFDTDAGVLECEAGVTLAEILALVVPQGWFLPVTPGTRFVTVGGAIANDVHGKNHGQAGSFGDHVQGFELLRSDGSRWWCGPDDAVAPYRATLGGLGLTGLVTRVRLRLRRIHGTGMEVETQRFGQLADFFALSREKEASEYAVAWVDCLARGAALGRGVFSHGRHAPEDLPGPDAPGKRPMVPFTPPFSLVNAASLRAFNTLYFRRAPDKPNRAVVHFESFFYPLDGIAEWNRLYGPRGFLQYQCVVPPEVAEAATAEMLDRIAASKQGSFLVVLKQFGDRTGPGMLSFPRPGTTLAMDFPFRGQATLDLLASLDRVVMAAGGAVYPAKDARMPPEVFAASFPRLAEFRQHVDPRFSSGFWRRVMGEA